MELVPTKSKSVLSQVCYMPGEVLVGGYAGNEGQWRIAARTKKTRVAVPQRIKLDIEVKSIASSPNCILLLSKKGEVYEYSNGTTVRIPELSGIVKLRCGDSHFIALNSDGQCFAWGSGATGCLGNFSFKDVARPTTVMTDYRIADIECGAHTTFFLTEDGETYSCGSNLKGELAISTVKHCCLPHKVDTKGIVVVQIAAGETHTLFLSKEGNIYVAGNAREGQLGISDELTDLISTKLRKLDSKTKFVRVAASNYSAALSADGVVYVWGTSVFGIKPTPTIFTKQSNKFLELAVGKDSGFAVASNGQMWVWGTNSEGELGVGDFKPRDKPFPLVQLDKFAVDRVFTGANRSFCVSVGEYQKKVFERECCQGQHHHQHSYQQQKGVLAERNKENRSLNRSLVSAGTKSIRSKLSSMIEFNKSKAGKSNPQRLKSRGKQNKPKSIVNKKQRKLDAQMSFQTSERESLNNDLRSEVHQTEVVAPLKYSFIRQRPRLTMDGNMEGLFDRIRSCTPEPKLSSEYKNFISVSTHDHTACDQQKAHLLRIIEEKDFIITDITDKIRLLEQAIAEKEKMQEGNHQRLDYIEELRKNERRYLQEIQKLTHLINNLVDGKEGEITRKLRHRHYASVPPHVQMVDTETQNYSVLKSLNRECQEDQAVALREEVIALEKHIRILNQQHQTELRHNRAQIEQLTAKLRQLERVIQQKDHTIVSLKRQLQRRDDTEEPVARHGRSLESQLVLPSQFRQEHGNHDRDGPPFESDRHRRRNHHLPSNEVEKTLQRIEENRQRISDSANKLIHILDMSM